MHIECIALPHCVLTFVNTSDRVDETSIVECEFEHDQKEEVVPSLLLVVLWLFK